jgi:hypothetical protein
VFGQRREYLGSERTKEAEKTKESEEEANEEKKALPEPNICSPCPPGGRGRPVRRHGWVKANGDGCCAGLTDGRAWKKRLDLV